MSPSAPEGDAGPGGPLADIDVVILAGGLGTRIRHLLGDTPKVLAPVGGRPLLEHLLDRLMLFGARRAILSLGHLAERVISHLGRHPRPGLEVLAVVEPEPLGTAGGLRYVRPWIESDPVLVVNGDTYTRADLGALVRAHRASGARASLLCLAAPSTARYGRLELGAGGRIHAFREKDAGADEAGLVSAGTYLFSRGFLDGLGLHEGPSLERDVLERLAPGTIQGVVDRAGAFVDIGTPEGLKQADARLTPLPGPVRRTAAA